MGYLIPLLSLREEYEFMYLESGNPDHAECLSEINGMIDILNSNKELCTYIFRSFGIDLCPIPDVIDRFLDFI